MKIILPLILICVFICGCKPAEPVEPSNLTAGMVKKEIVEGVTTQQEILEVFGPPNIITKSKSGNEVWTYDTISVRQTSKDGYWNVIVAGGGSDKSSTSTKTFTLMIEFDSKEVVKSCSYRSSAF